MKSAYEIAMSRLEKSNPSVKLNEKQKQEISDIDSQHAAKIAERKIFLDGEIFKARQSGNEHDAESLQKQLASEIARIEEEREEKKEKVRKSA